MRSVRTCGVLVLAATVGLSAACSSGNGGNSGSNGNSPNSNQTVTLTWWHNGTADPALTEWKKLADQYHASHPNVSFKIEPLQNEQFTTKVPLALQGNAPPDIYQQWGSGAQATQVESGKLMDMTAALGDFPAQLGGPATSWQTDGKWYGLPFDLHTVGFWYRKDLFQRAGIMTPPTTMDDFYADVTKLKQANIAPVAIGSKDKWPDAFWWEYFAIRECSADTVKNAIKNANTSDACFVKAGNDLKALLAANPFQQGFLGTSAQQGAGSSAGLVANGKAAMELMGDWEAAVMPSLATDPNYAANLSWLPGATLGGGDGYSCTSKAGSACPDFLKYLASPDVQKQLVQAKVATLPVNPAANSAVTDPTLKLVLTASQQSPFAQTYFDQALSTAVGRALNDAIANYLAGKGTPESIAGAVAEAAKNQ